MNDGRITKVLRTSGVVALNAVLVWHTVDIWHSGLMMLAGFFISMVAVGVDIALIGNRGLKKESEKRARAVRQARAARPYTLHGQRDLVRKSQADRKRSKGVLK